jgi:hypothetical protein
MIAKKIRAAIFSIIVLSVVVFILSENMPSSNIYGGGWRATEVECED